MNLDAAIVSALTSVAMVTIWMIYLQLIFIQYRRSNRPFLIIHHAHDSDPNALCLFVNMSKEPVHVQCVVAHVRGVNGYVRRNVTDYRRITPDDRNVQSRLRQGPIQPGGYLLLGSFEDIMLGRQSDPEESEESENRYLGLRGIDSLELCVAVVHGPSRFYIGARRYFLVEHNEGQVIIRALSIHTEQQHLNERAGEDDHDSQVFPEDSRGEPHVRRTRLGNSGCSRVFQRRRVLQRDFLEYPVLRSAATSAVNERVFRRPNRLGLRLEAVPKKP